MQRDSQAVAKLRNYYHRLKRVGRVLRGRDIWTQTEVDCDRVWLGNEGARWCVDTNGLSSASVIYSFGVGEDISFERELIRRLGARVHAFDPTPRSICWVRNQVLPREFLFHEYGIAGFDGSCLFLPPENPSHVSYTISDRPSSQPAVPLTVHRLTTVMKMLGHDRIDVLKMDVEGAEYDVISDLMASEVVIKQLLVEFHHRWPNIGVAKTRQAIRKLSDAGFRIFDVSPTGEEYSFQRCDKPLSSLRFATILQDSPQRGG